MQLLQSIVKLSELNPTKDNRKASKASRKVQYGTVAVLVLAMLYIISKTIFNFT